MAGRGGFAKNRGKEGGRRKEGERVGEGKDESDYKKLRTLYCDYDGAGWIEYQYLRR